MAVHFKENSDTTCREMTKPHSGNRRKSVFCTPYHPVNDYRSESLLEKKSPIQKNWLMNKLNSLFLFSALEPKWQEDLIETIGSRHVASGEYVFKQGEVSETFYIIQKGLFHEYATKSDGGEKYVTSHESGCFGEIGLLHDRPFERSLVAGSEGLIWTLERDHYRRIASTSAHARRQLNLGLLRAVAILQPLPGELLVKIADSLQRVAAPDGARIVLQGQPAAGLHIVEAGRVTLKLADCEQREVETRVLEAGEIFGQDSLRGHPTEDRSAYALGDVRLLLLPPDTYVRLVGPLGVTHDRKSPEELSTF